MVVLAILAFVLSGGDPQVVQDVIGGLPRQEQADVATTAASDELADFTSVVLASTEDVWSAILRADGLSYQPPQLVIFSDHVDSACGFQDAAVGPFYCPRDRKAYLDLRFFDDLHVRFGAPGDFAQAYVIAHEIGHHVQTVFDLPASAAGIRTNEGRSHAEEASLRQELQADCFAGVWAHHARAMLEPGDLEEGLAAAAAIGDDRLQRQGRGYVTPESFTHGSSAQRVRWFRAGFEAGDPARCDTYAVAQP